MRTIDQIVIHCSATPEGRKVTAQDINRWHREQGWRTIGYHYVIELDGTLKFGRKLSEVGAHAEGFNRHSVGICYVGGLDREGKEPKNTLTRKQEEGIIAAICDVLGHFPYGTNIKICGHRDLPGVTKACPSLSVEELLGRWSMSQHFGVPDA